MAYIQRKLTESEQFILLSLAEELLKQLGIDIGCLRVEKTIETNYYNPTISSIIKQKNYKQSSLRKENELLLPAINLKNSVIQKQQNYKSKGSHTSRISVRRSHQDLHDSPPPPIHKSLKSVRSEEHIRRYLVSPRSQVRLSGAADFSTTFARKQRGSL